MKRDLKQYILDNFDTALEKCYIQPYYQPVIRSISGQLCSFEALARWVDPVHGLIRPDEFIPVLEEAQLIHLLDIHVIREVCRQYRRCEDAARTTVPVSVSFNLSRLDFLLCDVFEAVDACANAFQVPHDCLHAEITESVAVEQEGLLRKVIDRFHEAGYQVWMDDFGSGYSSLNMLKDYPFDEIKLDMRFLSSFDQRSRRILTSIIQMAKEIGIHTLAEGVETAEQFEYLRDIGCEKVQGYYFGKPMPWDEAMEALRQKGIAVEKPSERRYYDEIGKLNFLSPIPFASEKERNRMVSGRELNSLPLALVEVKKNSFCFLFRNSAFEENLMKTGFVSAERGHTPLGVSIPNTRIPLNVFNILDCARTSGEGRLEFVSNEEYYELRCKRVSKTRSAYCVLMQMDNLSQSAKGQTGQLDEGLREFYTIYDGIVLLELERDRVTPLLNGAIGDLHDAKEDIAAYAQDYAVNWIYPEDQAMYRDFMELSQMDERLEKAPRHILSCMLRTRTRQRRFTWKLYTLLRTEPGVVLALARDLQQPLTCLEGRLRPPEDTVYTTDMLWRNLVNSNLVRLFWKDADRRFLGASRSFLEYYGFASEDEIIGKNDEDLGWHVHPDGYMDVELQVIQEGVSTHNVPGNCIRSGENRDILASKVPLYSENGEVLGLMGCFIDRELLTVNDKRGSETKNRDPLTGLLNERGIAEASYAFRDEYYRRNTDFARLQIGIDELDALNRHYGFDFADKVIAGLGRKLKLAFGTNAAVGRVNGGQFVVLRQLREKGELSALHTTAKHVFRSFHEIEETQVTLYFSLGYARFSECESLEELAQKAGLRMLADQKEHTSTENRLSRSAEIFRLYDDLPIAYAVYRVLTDEEDRVKDAVLFYVNHLFERNAGREAREMLGHTTRELFPELGEDWYLKAARAALQGETVTESMAYAGTGMRYYLTASQVIRPGYCCFTYQELETLDKPGE